MNCDKCGAEWIEYHCCEKTKIGLCPICNPEIFAFNRMTIPKGYFWCCTEKKLIRPSLSESLRPSLSEPLPMPAVRPNIKPERVIPAIRLVHNPELDGIIAKIIENEPAWTDFCNGKESAIGSLVGLVKKKVKIAPVEIKARIERLR